MSLFTETLKYTEYIKCKVNTSKKKKKKKYKSLLATRRLLLVCLVFYTQVHLINTSHGSAQNSHVFLVCAQAAGVGHKLLLEKYKKKKRSPHPRIKYK